LVDSISISPNGWTDQELGIAWLRNDFDPATRDKAAGQYRLLILDGHNSHCTFSFCNYAVDNKIIIICLPSHTTHAFQPCDVSTFGPLAQSWKQVVTLASQSLIAIKKDNLLVHYHTAHVEALKPTTIQSAFRKTGIWPVNRDVIPQTAFEPSKNTTTQAAQPLPAHLPSILVPTPTPMPIPTPTPTPIPTPVPTPMPSDTITIPLRCNADMPVGAAEGLPVEEEPMQRYHIEIPPPLPGTSSRQALRAENMTLRDIIKQAGIALEEDYAQMKLMDLENERLRKRVFEKEKQKNPHKLSSGRVWHMTAAKQLDLLAQQDWGSCMKEVFKEVALRFKS
jgi:DDE superfamily endonuclease